MAKKQKMTARDVIDRAGGAPNVAKSLGVRQAVVRQWICRDSIALGRVVQVAKIAGVTPYDVRPDVFPKGMK